MTQHRSLTVLLIALLALLAPSVTAGMSAVAANGIAVAITADDGAESPLYQPCESRGGKRSVPCSTDLGVLVSAPAAPVPTKSEVRAVAADPMRRLLAPAAEPPPPRRA